MDDSYKTPTTEAGLRKIIKKQNERLEKLLIDENVLLTQLKSTREQLKSLLDTE